MNSMHAWIKLIEAWANERNIINGCEQKDQFAKLVSEFGELCGHLDELHGHSESLEVDDFHLVTLLDKISDDIGDCVVVCTILAAQNGDCLANLIGADSMPVGPNQHSALLNIGAAMGRLGDSILKKNALDTAFNLSSIVDYLSAVASSYKLLLSECIEKAYNDIKDRRGIMYNGTFVKESDPKYEEICGRLSDDSGEDRSWH